MIDLDKEREAFESAYQHHSFIKTVYRDGNYYSVMPSLNISKDEKKLIVSIANSSWNSWQRCKLRAQEEINDLKQQLAEVHKSRVSWVEYSQKIESGEFVLVPRDKIEVFWQDDEEPENFINKESDFDCLGDCLDLNDIMTINTHYQVNLKTEKIYGTWFAEFGNPKEKANFHVGTHQECLEIVANNKTMIEASQQPKNLIDSFIADGGFDKAINEVK